MEAPVSVMTLPGHCKVVESCQGVPLTCHSLAKSRQRGGKLLQCASDLPLSCDSRNIMSCAVADVGRTRLMTGSCFQEALACVVMQANQRILDSVAQRLCLPADRVISNLEGKCGGRSCACFRVWQLCNPCLRLCCTDLFGFVRPQNRELLSCLCLLLWVCSACWEMPNFQEHVQIVCSERASSS